MTSFYNIAHIDQVGHLHMIATYAMFPPSWCMFWLDIN
jgi:hypothetical protein